MSHLSITPFRALYLEGRPAALTWAELQGRCSHSCFCWPFFCPLGLGQVSDHPHSRDLSPSHKAPCTLDPSVQHSQGLSSIGAQELSEPQLLPQSQTNSSDARQTFNEDGWPKGCSLKGLVGVSLLLVTWKMSCLEKGIW